MATYSDQRYGPRRRVVLDFLDDFGATGQGTPWTCKVKTKFYKFGIIPTTTACRSTTTGALAFETTEGTDLGTWTFAALTTMALGIATGATITATTMAAGTRVCGNVTEAGSKGSFVWFFDVQEVFAATGSESAYA